MPAHPQRFRPSSNRPRRHAPAQPPLSRPPRARSHAPTGDRAAACPWLRAPGPASVGVVGARAASPRRLPVPSVGQALGRGGRALPDESGAARRQTSALGRRCQHPAPWRAGIPRHPGLRDPVGRPRTRTPRRAVFRGGTSGRARVWGTWFAFVAVSEFSGRFSCRTG